jgi:hypothetical protein
MRSCKRLSYRRVNYQPSQPTFRELRQCEVRRIPLLRGWVYRGKGRAGAAIRPGPSCEICALTLAPRELFCALPSVRYL